MATVKLTTRSARTLRCPAGARDATWWDSVLPGFYLRVSGRGARSWGVWYRVGRRARRKGLGRVGVVSLAAARRRAEEILTEAKLRSVDLGARPSALDLVAVVDAWLDATKRRRSEKTAADYRSAARAHLQNPTGRLPMDELRRHHLQALLARVAERAPVAARALRKLVRAACRWALAEEMIARDPTLNLEQPAAATSRERVLGDDELVKLWAALERAPDEVAAYLRLLLILGQRSTETATMRWQDLDLRARLWKIPGRFRKGDAYHVVPLPQLAVDVLDAIPRSGTTALPGLDLQNVDRWLDPVRAAAGLVESWHRHDLRRTCASGLARLGADRTTIALVLGHEVREGGAVTAVYDRFDRLPQRAAALNAWASHIEGLVGIERPAAEVVPIGRAAG